MKAAYEEYAYQKGEDGRDIRCGKGTGCWLKKWNQALESSLTLAAKGLSRAAYMRSPDESTPFCI